MRGLWAIFKRELLSFFVTPVAWIAMFVFLLLQGLHFFVVLASFADNPHMSTIDPVQTFFGQTVFLYLPLFFVCPVLTMRIFAEERRSGTIEPLLTAPVSTTAVVLGKYSAVLAVYLAIWAPTLFYMWLVSSVGTIDWNVAGSSYLAVLCVGASYLSIGVMTSSLTRSQLSAALLSALAIIGTFIVGVGGEFLSPEGAFRDVSSYVSVWSQMNDFSRGIVDSRRLVYNATIVVLPLFITVRAVDSWRLE